MNYVAMLPVNRAASCKSGIVKKETPSFAGMHGLTQI